MLQCSHRRKFISHLPLSFSSPIGVCCSKTRLHARMAQQRVEVSPRDLPRPAVAFGYDATTGQSARMFGCDAATCYDLPRRLGVMSRSGVRLGLATAFERDAAICHSVWE